ncbi:MAG: nucleic acid-binding protein [Candidatus Electrothrix sp. MAN1_4]|nr:nucleic acid-binding protein [Candidatus Electrothrix sp. MAN1_4]
MGWVNLFNPKERHYKQVSSLYMNLRSVSGSIVTTDYVLDEVWTMLFKRVPFPSACKALEAVNQAVAEGYIVLERISPERFEATQQLRLRLQDKPDISFTDLTSMIVMQEVGITDIMTGDAHFTHVGMGFILLPG